MTGARAIPRLAFGATITRGTRMLPEEMAVALSFNGSTQAVMMATPADLEDLARGFALTEGIAQPIEIESIEVVETARGIDLQIWLADAAAARLGARRRNMAGPVGCGLCGIDSLEAALRPPPCLPASAFRITPAQVSQAVAALAGHQPLHRLTHAAHCAGFWVPGAGMITREDVGRHNALDKLAGHLARTPVAERIPASEKDADQGVASGGALVITSRVSLDMVQKAAAMGAPVLIALAAPTTHAVAYAEDCGLTLVALAREERFEVFSHSDRLVTETRNVV